MRSGVQGVKGLDRDKVEDLTHYSYAQLVQHPDCTRALDIYVYIEDCITCCCRCGCIVVVVSSLAWPVLLEVPRSISHTRHSSVVFLSFRHWLGADIG